MGIACSYYKSSRCVRLQREDLTGSTKEGAGVSACLGETGGEERVEGARRAHTNAQLNAERFTPSAQPTDHLCLNDSGPPFA